MNCFIILPSRTCLVFEVGLTSVSGFKTHVWHRAGMCTRVLHSHVHRSHVLSKPKGDSNEEAPPTLPQQIWGESKVYIKSPCHQLGEPWRRRANCNLTPSSWSQSRPRSGGTSCSRFASRSPTWCPVATWSACSLHHPCEHKRCTRHGQWRSRATESSSQPSACQKPGTLGDR